MPSHGEFLTPIPEEEISYSQNSVEPEAADNTQLSTLEESTDKPNYELFQPELRKSHEILQEIRNNPNFVEDRDEFMILREIENALNVEPNVKAENFDQLPYLDLDRNLAKASIEAIVFDDKEKAVHYFDRLKAYWTRAYPRYRDDLQDWLTQAKIADRLDLKRDVSFSTKRAFKLANTELDPRFRKGDKLIFKLFQAEQKNPQIWTSLYEFKNLTHYSRPQYAGLKALVAATSGGSIEDIDNHAQRVADQIVTEKNLHYREDVEAYIHLMQAYARASYLAQTLEDKKACLAKADHLRILLRDRMSGYRPDLFITAFGEVAVAYQHLEQEETKSLPIPSSSPNQDTENLPIPSTNISNNAHEPGNYTEEELAVARQELEDYLKSNE